MPIGISRKIERHEYRAAEAPGAARHAPQTLRAG